MNTLKVVIQYIQILSLTTKIENPKPNRSATNPLKTNTWTNNQLNWYRLRIMKRIRRHWTSNRKLKQKRSKTERWRGEKCLVLWIKLLFELGDFTLFGGGEILGVMAAHDCAWDPEFSERIKNQVEEKEEEEEMEGRIGVRRQMKKKGNCCAFFVSIARPDEIQAGFSKPVSYPSTPQLFVLFSFWPLDFYLFSFQSFCLLVK